MKMAGDMVGVSNKELYRLEKKYINYLGGDISPKKISLLESIVKGKPEVLKKYSKNQIASFHELAFWRWVAYEGYLSYHPIAFSWFQKLRMFELFLTTGWEAQDFAEKKIIEVGNGPLGMIECIPGHKKVGYDPLNDDYSKLFSKVRSKEIIYKSDMSNLKKEKNDYDLLICINTLDHTDEPEELFSDLMRALNKGGRFIIQVNTVKEGWPRNSEHKAMHPSPLTEKEMLSLISQYSQKYDHFTSDKPTLEGEFFFMAWGCKK